MYTVSRSVTTSGRSREKANPQICSTQSYIIGLLYIELKKEEEEEGNVLFNNTLNTFYLRL